MKQFRIFLTALLIAFTGFFSYGQTQSALPPGSTSYSGNLFKDLSGNVWTGKVGSYTNLGSWFKVDSLFQIKGGTVSSVGLSLPNIFSVTGSPVTTNGTLSATLANQTANTFFAGPATGSPATPTFRALQATDIPALDAAKITTGVLNPARLGTGTPAATSVLYGDGSWKVPDYIPISQKGAADGVATLGADGKIPNGQIPAIALTETFVVNSQPDMLALAAEMGDVAVRTDLSKSFILTNNNPALVANWQELLSPSVANTDQVPEGSTNLYFTPARARAAISATGSLTYNPATGVMGYTMPIMSATVPGGAELFSNTVQSVAANSVTATAGRTYGTQLNSDGQLVVNVPWTNDNTTYTSSNGITLTGTNFTPTYGTTANTIAQGNDSRILNGQTAFGWGDFRDYGLGRSVVNITNTNNIGTLARFYRMLGNLSGTNPLGSGAFLNMPFQGGQTFILGLSESGIRVGDINSSGVITHKFDVWHSGNLRSNTENDARYFLKPTGTTSQYIRGDGSLAAFPTAVVTNLALGTRTTTTVPVTNSNGTGFTIPVSTPSLAGVMSAEDKTKLDALNPATDGKASNLFITSDLTINWAVDIAPDETGAPSGQTWATRYGNSIYILRMYQDGSVWRDASDQYTINLSGQNIQSINFHTVLSNTRISITGKGGGAPVGLFNNKGNWASGTYQAGDYVFAPSTANPSVRAMYFLIGQNDYASTTSPQSDLTHWSELPAAAGPKGDQGDPGADGAAGPGVATGGTAGQWLMKVNSTNFNTVWADAPVTTWSSITGVPSTFAPSAHTHNASDINAGVLAIGRIPTGTTASTVAIGNDSRILNGQTAFGWGNHASAGYAITGTGGTQVRTNTDLDSRYLQSSQVFGTTNTTVRNNQQLDARYAQSSTLGTASTRNVGTSADNVVALDGTGKLPAVDGSQLTNLPSSTGVYPSVVEANSNLTLNIGQVGGMVIGTAPAINITVPTNASVAFPIGTKIEFFAASGTLTLSGSGGVSIQAPDGVLTLGNSGLNYGILFKTGTNTWRLIKLQTIDI